LLALGVGRRAIVSWLRSERVVEVLPRVYGLGHRAPSREADLWAAVLYAGPGAMLSHATAAQWRGLIDFPPQVIEVSTPRGKRSLPGIRVRGRRRLDRHLHNALPVTSTPQTLLDLAATAEFKLVPKVLARLDFLHDLDLAALEAICGQASLGAKRFAAPSRSTNPALPTPTAP
jgi:hypothetical protein